jgi:hypothetical protein
MRDAHLNYRIAHHEHVLTLSVTNTCAWSELCDYFVPELGMWCDVLEEYGIVPADADAIERDKTVWWNMKLKQQETKTRRYNNDCKQDPCEQTYHIESIEDVFLIILSIYLSLSFDLYLIHTKGKSNNGAYHFGVFRRR